MSPHAAVARPRGSKREPDGKEGTERTKAGYSVLARKEGTRRKSERASEGDR